MKNFTTNQLRSPSGNSTNDISKIEKMDCENLSKNSENKNLLHLEFIRLGRERHKITYKLLALLPKIYKSGIYQEKGFSSIFEYSFKLAGLSESLVKKALKLDEHLRDKPYLQKMIASQGIHKVALVAKIATPQTDSFFADKVENMSKNAIQELSKEIRQKNEGIKFQKENMKIEFDDEMEFLFLKIKNKLGKGSSNKEVLKKLFKEYVIEKIDKHTKVRISQKIPRGNFSRYVPINIKRQIIQKTEGKCAHENCNKPYEILHHTKRFALNKNSESVHENIIPLCREHHEFAHNGLLKEDKSAWVNTVIDKKYREYRQKFLVENDLVKNI